MCQTSMATVVRYLVTALVLLVVQLDLVVAVSQVINVNWTVNHESSTLRCIGGRVAGLINTTVQLQYRTINTASAVIGDWITLDALPVNISSAVAHNLNFDSTVGGVQFRSLQLEHGGGGCNCWSDSFSVDGASRSTSACFRVPTSGPFCDGNARDARGVIRSALYFNMSGEDCPGDSNSTLISNKGPPLLKNCSTTTPRM